MNPFVNFPNAVRKVDGLHPKQDTALFLAQSPKLLPIKSLSHARKIENIPRSVWNGEVNYFKRNNSLLKLT